MALLLIGCEIRTDHEREVYAVYSAALAELLVTNGSYGPIFIRGRAPVEEDAIWFVTDEPYRPETLALSDATWTSFVKRNRTWTQVVDSFSGLPEHTVLSAEWENLAAIDRAKAEAELGRQYRAVLESSRERHTMVFLSRPGFNRAGTEALVHISIVCGGPCGFGEFVLLRRDQAGWSVVAREQNWIG